MWWMVRTHAAGGERGGEFGYCIGADGVGDVAGGGFDGDCEVMTLQKLTPNHDLQCYFFQPSAIAALSSTSASGFTVSGTWRQQFDWAVVEWNRDNVFEHPAFRYLPDGDLSGLTLSYQETRENCILLDSDLYPTVAWPTLRIWANNGSGEQVYQISLTSYATHVAGSYACATVQFTLGGTVTAGDYVG